MNIDDEKIVKIIKEKVGERPIKKTSSQILARFEREKARPTPRKPWFKLPAFKVGLTFVATSLVIGVFVYLNREDIVPPIVTTSEDITNSSTISSSEEPVSLVLEPSKTIDSKEGEFVLLSLTATSYIPNPEVDLTFYKGGPGGNHQNDDYSQSEIGEVLDEAMPLVEDFYLLEGEFNYIKNEGSFVGEYGVYTHQFIIDETTQIIANVDFEEEDDELESEIEGEIIILEKHYRYEGESEYDLVDQERDFSMKIAYSEDSYLELESENNGNNQKFKYKLVNQDEEIFKMEIETFRHGHEEKRYTKVEVEMNDKEYNFIFHRQNDEYIAEISRMRILIHKEEEQFIYTFI